MARGRHPTRIYIAPPDAATEAKYLFRWEGRHLFHETHHFPVLTSQEIFGNDRPLEIDFGCGQGAFACDRAGLFPRSNIIGIDKSHKPLYCAVQNAASAGLDNIKFIRGDFNAMLRLLRPQTLNAAYYLFPNPPLDYHQERANGHRRLFLQSVLDALICDGRLYFATDAPSFFDCMFGLVNERKDCRLLETDIVNSAIGTRYRQLWERQGRNFRSLVVEKNACRE